MKNFNITEYHYETSYQHNYIKFCSYITTTKLNNVYKVANNHNTCLKIIMAKTEIHFIWLQNSLLFKV